MKRCVCLLALSMALGVLAVPANAWYPSATQVEFCTATW